MRPPGCRLPKTAPAQNTGAGKRRRRQRTALPRAPTRSKGRKSAARRPTRMRRGTQPLSRSTAAPRAEGGERGWTGYRCRRAPADDRAPPRVPPQRSSQEAPQMSLRPRSRRQEGSTPAPTHPVGATLWWQRRCGRACARRTRTFPRRCCGPASLCIWCPSSPRCDHTADPYQIIDTHLHMRGTLLPP